VADAWAEVDQPVLVDPRVVGLDGHPPYLPMTSMAGALRRHFAEDANRWLGPPPPDREDTEQAPEIGGSRLRLLGATGLDGAAAVRTRGRTSVDGRRGAALGKSHRTEQWVEPADASIAAWHDGDLDDALVESLARWTPFVGRGRTTGHGRAAVSAVDAMTVDLGDEDQLTWWLTERDVWLRGEAERPGWARGRTAIGDAGANETSGSEQLVFQWKVTDPIHVGEGRADGSTGGSTAAVIVRSAGEAILPGSAWKGLFRHRVETILGAVGGESATIERITEILFGSTSIGRGRVWFGDSGFGEPASPEAETTPPQVRTHIAIDRFTGGVRDGALFQLESVPAGSECTLSIIWEGRSCPAEVSNLLRHVVRDVHDRIVGVGGNVSRGYGSLELIDEAPMADLQPVLLADLVSALGLDPAPARVIVPTQADGDVS